MKCALFIAENAKTESPVENRPWQTFVAYAKQNTGQNKDVSKLNEGTYLCNLSGGISGLSILVRHAEEHGIHSRTLFFDQDPSWVITNG